MYTFLTADSFYLLSTLDMMGWKGWTETAAPRVLLWHSEEIVCIYKVCKDNNYTITLYMPEYYVNIQIFGCGADVDGPVNAT